MEISPKSVAEEGFYLLWEDKFNIPGNVSRKVVVLVQLPLMFMMFISFGQQHSSAKMGFQRQGNGGKYIRKDGSIGRWIPPKKQCPLCPFYGIANYVNVGHYQTQHLNERNWPCDQCDSIFKVDSALKTHKKNVHDKIFIQCPVCDFSNVRQSVLNLHIRDNHMGAKTLECSFCSFQSVNEEKLQKHVKIDHLKIREECPKCGYEAKDKNALTKHIKSTHSMNIRKSHQCTYCDFSTPSKQYFNIHVNSIHLKIFKHICEICDYKTNQSTHLKEHMTSRHGVGGYKCSECDYKNAYQSNLDEHVKQVHLKVRELICMYCEACFGVKEALKHHVLVKHRTIKQLKCDHCEYATNLTSSLNKHIKRRHINTNDMYKCQMQECNYSTNMASNLKTHERRHSKSRKRYACPEDDCKQEFVWKEYVKMHVNRVHKRIRDFHCSKCDFVTSTKRSLDDHEKKIHTEREKNTCPECNKTFIDLKVHMLHSHSGRNEKCHECDKTFVTKKQVKYHVARTHAMEPKHACQSCHLKFKTHQNLLRHDKGVHLKLKDIKCPHCEKTMSTKDDLSKHIFSKHTSDRVPKFPCQSCEKQFFTRQSLLIHNKGVHLNLKDIECPNCDFTTSTNGSLKSHILYKHTSGDDHKHKCTICNYSTASKPYLLQHHKSVHLRQKDIKCPHCDFMVSAVGNLRSHILYKHASGDIKKYKCELCDFSAFIKSTLSKHVKSIHLNLKDMKCPDCEFAASTNSNLKLHILNMHTSGQLYKCELCSYGTNINSKLNAHIKKH